MGVGISATRNNSSLKEQVQRNKNIENELEAQKLENLRSLKLLMLGPGESGKSTVLKQMRIVHSEGFSDIETQHEKGMIRINVIQAMTNILNAMKVLEISCNPERKRDIEVVLETGKMLNEGAGDDMLSPEVTEAIKQLWMDESVQECYERRSEFQLIDSAKYQDDILRCRIKTTGVTEVRFTIKGMLFRVIDVGGQRSERRKWIQCFSEVTTIIFVASLSEYNQKLMEDGITNRMEESLKLFQWICNHKIFLKTSIILFLNKKDIFLEKLQTTPITVAFPEYTGSQTAAECIEYIKGGYLKFNRDEKEKLIYPHETCATDTTQMTFVLRSTINTILRETLSHTGML